jgi:acyl-CoA thioesterase YciA
VVLAGYGNRAAGPVEKLGCIDSCNINQARVRTMNDIDSTPIPQGDLALQTVAMPKDTNASGDIFGGWLLSQMDIAGMITASDVANGRVATVAIDGMAFLTPVHVGAVVSCYCDVLEIGRSSVRIMVEVWINSPHDGDPLKVTEGEFVFVAIDKAGRTRSIKS